MVKQEVVFNYLSKSDGSAVYTLGDTVVLASVLGPTNSRQAARLHNKSSTDVQLCPRTGQASVDDRALEKLIKHEVDQCLARHLHPRTSIVLNIQELQSDYPQQLLSASLNASMLALLDAGVQMRSLAAAVTCCVRGGEVVCEPPALDVEGCDSTITFIFENLSTNLIGCEQQGSLSPEDYDKCLCQSKAAADSVFSFYRRQMVERYDSSVRQAVSAVHAMEANFELA